MENSTSSRLAAGIIWYLITSAICGTIIVAIFMYAGHLEAEREDKAEARATAEAMPVKKQASPQPPLTRDQEVDKIVADAERQAKQEMDKELLVAEAMVKMLPKILVPAVAPAVVPGVAVAVKTEFTCNTGKHIVIIDEPSVNSYRYRSWNLPKKIDAKPDLEVKAGTWVTEGKGVCRYQEWTFKTGNVELLVSDNVKCVEGHPPQNAIGSLHVLVKDELKNQYWCSK